MKVMVRGFDKVKGQRGVRPIQEGEETDRITLKTGPGQEWEIIDGGGDTLKIKTLEGWIVIEPDCSNQVRIRRELT